MGVSILWKPVRNDGVSLSVGGRSDFVEALREVFGQEPWEFSAEHLATLRGIGAGAKEREAIDELSAAIAKHGIVEVFLQY